MKTISFINIKGGVAKTTSAIAFAQLLALEQGKRVIVVDNDKQANATELLLKSDYNAGLTTADLLTSRKPIATDAIVTTSYGVDLIPANFSLIDANRSALYEAVSREHRYKMQLESIADRYDYCIIDNPPDANIGVTNALIASDHVLIPTIGVTGFKGLEYTLRVIDEAREWNPSLRTVGCFLTMLSSRGNLGNLLKQVHLAHGADLAFRTSIRYSTHVMLSDFKAPLLSFEPKGAVANDYRALLNEYFERAGV